LDGISEVNGAYAKGYSFSAEAGMAVTITLDSDDFDAFLYLLDKDGMFLALDDDGGGGRNAKLVYVLPYTGTYYVEATQYPFETPGETGSFKISITVSDAADVDNTIIQFAALMNPDRLYFLEVDNDPRGLELEQEALAVYGMIRLGHFVIVPVEWQYDSFDSGTPGIRMITGEISLPIGYAYDGGELTVQSPVLVYDPDGEPVEKVSDILHPIFPGSGRRNIIPLGMPAVDVQAHLSGHAENVLIETVNGYRFFVDISLDASKVDTSAVGVYYPIALHFPPGIGFDSDEYTHLETAVYVLDPDEVDLRAVNLTATGFIVRWIKGISAPELWVSVNEGEWQNILDGGPWLGSWQPVNVFSFQSSPFFNEFDIVLNRFATGHTYDFEVRYENGGISLNTLRVDLTGSRPNYYPYEGDRTGGDRYRNPWDVITGGGNDGGSNNGSGDNGDDNGSGNNVTPPNGSGNGSGNNPEAETSGMPDAGQNTTVTGSNGNEPDGVPQTPISDSGESELQQPLGAGNLILEPSNPIVTPNTGTASGGDNLYNESTAVSGLNIGTGGFVFDLDGGDPMEIRFDFPFDDFDGLYINGELWIPGVDYTARSGSTIITVSAERLARLGAGSHTLTAVFAGVPVEVVLTLNAPALVSQTPALRAPVVPQIPLPNILAEPSLLIEQMETSPSFPMFAIVMSIIAIAGFSALLAVYLRRRTVSVSR
jgi:hypothetical protein